MCTERDRVPRGGAAAGLEPAARPARRQGGAPAQLHGRRARLRQVSATNHRGS